MLNLETYIKDSSWQIRWPEGSGTVLPCGWACPSPYLLQVRRSRGKWLRARRQAGGSWTHCLLSGHLYCQGGETTKSDSVLLLGHVPKEPPKYMRSDVGETLTTLSWCLNIKHRKLNPSLVNAASWYSSTRFGTECGPELLLPSTTEVSLNSQTAQKQ